MGPPGPLGARVLHFRACHWIGPVVVSARVHCGRSWGVWEGIDISPDSICFLAPVGYTVSMEEVNELVAYLVRETRVYVSLERWNEAERVAKILAIILASRPK